MEKLVPTKWSGWTVYNGPTDHLFLSCQKILPLPIPGPWSGEAIYFVVNGLGGPFNKTTVYLK